MKNALKTFWKENKFDICFIITACFFYSALDIKDINILNWNLWLAFILPVAFRLLGYAQGKYVEHELLIQNLLLSNSDICITIKNQKQYKLKDVSKGSYFSIVNSNKKIKEPLDKYLRVGLECTDNLILTFNLTKRKYEILDADNDVILYLHKSIYTPALEE